MGTPFSHLKFTNFSDKSKWFSRFTTHKNDDWYIGEDKWDALIFIPKKDVKILGVGIFGAYGSQVQRDLTLGYKYIIKEADSDNEIYASEVFKEHVECPPE